MFQTVITIYSELISVKYMAHAIKIYNALFCGDILV